MNDTLKEIARNPLETQQDTIELKKAKNILTEWERLTLQPTHEDILTLNRVKAELRYRADMLVTESENPKLLQRFFAEGGIETVEVGAKRKYGPPMRKRTIKTLSIFGVVALTTLFIANTEYFGWNNRGEATVCILFCAFCVICAILTDAFDLGSCSHHHRH